MERLEAEDYAAAAALIEKLAERLPDSPEVYSYLAYTYRKLGQEDAALAHYQRALFLEPGRRDLRAELRSEEHTSELQSLMRTSYAVFCLTKKKYNETKVKVSKRTIT